jgi:hypothetical protein
MIAVILNWVGYGFLILGLSKTEYLDLPLELSCFAD